eukprot:1191502-Rhodomonas_salina.1
MEGERGGEREREKAGQKETRGAVSVCVTAHRSPLTAHTSLLTSYLLPLTSHCSLLTAHCSPLIRGGTYGHLSLWGSPQ